VISAERTAPAVPTGSANDLGIREVLGVGYSSFAGSPSNRRANIRHGADKLNGLLIAPGETLSLLENLRPFTIADGYLPELVIKGDKIIPEIGGGLCQIGTTTFRAAMNSGLEIAERRNHSLVVSYYNDPSNGQPGTDATIYDPSPDLKILNDTANYIMLVTTVDSATSELFFTFWGTSDGRAGSYTPPVVLSWTGYGATQETETTTLAPGVRQCQSPHPGATTTFDYNIVMPDGSVKTREFYSSYRSLPTICLVGVGGNGETPAGAVQGVSDGPLE
jgi:vancomycin resistance protein YoaR